MIVKFRLFPLLNSAQCILVKAGSLDNEEGLISEMPVFSISFILIRFDRVSQRKNFNMKVVPYMPPKRERKSGCIEDDLPFVPVLCFVCRWLVQDFAPMY